MLYLEVKCLEWFLTKCYTQYSIEFAKYLANQSVVYQKRIQIVIYRYLKNSIYINIIPKSFRFNFDYLRQRNSSIKIINSRISFENITKENAMYSIELACKQSAFLCSH